MDSSFLAFVVYCYKISRYEYVIVIQKTDLSHNLEDASVFWLKNFKEGIQEVFYKLISFMFCMERKGEILTGKMATFFVALIGFAILALFIYTVFIDTDRLNQQQICHLSVLKRGALDEVGAAGLIPLQCTTQKICITTKRNGECKQFAGEENVIDVRIDLKKPNEAKRIIEEESANAMWDCWAMMGQGRVDIFGPDDIEDIEDVIWRNIKDFIGFEAKYKVTKPMCVVCSRIAIAEDVFEKDNGAEVVESVNVNRYIAEENIPGRSLTYLQAFTDSQIISYQGVDQGKGYEPDDIEVSELEALNEFRRDFNKGTVSESNQLAFVFSQIKFKDKDALTAGTNVAITGGIIIGAVLLLTPVGVIAIAATGLVTATIIGLGAVGAAAGYAAVTTGITNERNQIVTAGYCGNLQTESDDKVGCSLIKVVSWDAGSINSFCVGEVEGSP
ncbi:MAG: hypothetical protein IH948_08385 [Bacteroidetes bacterium]|nr:hypothetical protein [Bacteroidota bacterium]